MKSQHYDPEFRSAIHRRIIPGTKAIASWNGWAGFFSQLIIAFGFLIFGLTHFAFANTSGPRDSFRAADEQMARSVPSPVSVSGNLLWNDGVGKIEDVNSGRVYTIGNAQGLKSLWDSGVRKVAVTGHVDVGGVLNVDEVSTP